MKKEIPIGKFNPAVSRRVKKSEFESIPLKYKPTKKEKKLVDFIIKRNGEAIKGRTAYEVLDKQRKAQRVVYKKLKNKKVKYGSKIRIEGILYTIVMLEGVLTTKRGWYVGQYFLKDNLAYAYKGDKKYKITLV